MSLYNDLVTVFQQMKTNSDGDNHIFSDGIIEAVRASLESGDTTGTTYNGTCSLGTSAGTVTSTSSAIDGSANEQDAKDLLYSVLEGMNINPIGDDTVWAQGVTDAISLLIAGTTITEVLAGTVVPPVTPPPTVPAAGTGEGTLDDSIPVEPLYAALILIPAAMGTTGDDTILASMMSAAILIYFAAIICNFEGQGALAGLTGTNTMVGNT